MLLLHVVAMPAAARAGLVGLAAATSLVAGLVSRAAPSHHSTRANVMVMHFGHVSHRGPCGAERVRAMVIAERIRARADVRAQLRAEEALARATARIRHERAAMIATHGARSGSIGTTLSPLPPDVGALLAESEAMSRDGAMSPPTLAPLAPPAPAVTDLAPPAARDDADTSTRDRGIRVLAAIAFFLIGLA